MRNGIYTSRMELRRCRAGCPRFGSLNSPSRVWREGGFSGVVRLMIGLGAPRAIRWRELFGSAGAESGSDLSLWHTRWQHDEAKRTPLSPRSQQTGLHSPLRLALFSETARTMPAAFNATTPTRITSATPLLSACPIEFEHSIRFGQERRATLNHLTAGSLVRGTHG